ncbi:MAG TPA: transglutaminase-like domain-containing protein, partial [Rhodocyclaceae bacterium]|nr:transglutaminase-like domain-containing protein [Rhodocyclaceae bacterium]
MKRDLARLWTIRLLACDLGLLVVLVAWVIAQAVPSSEAVRLRNALLYDGVVPVAALNWSPSAPPLDYLQETTGLPEPLRGFADTVKLAPAAGNWAKARTIADHLQARLSDGGPIMAGLEETYRRIVEDGAGYCGDFADVFAALATAAGIPNRRWSFSFDGYGGHGHIFNEVWDDSAGRWRAIDVFNNYVFVDAASGEPLSALEFRAALRGERA